MALHAQLQGIDEDGGALLRQIAQGGDQVGPAALHTQGEVAAIKAFFIARGRALAAGHAQAARAGEIAHALQGGVAGLTGIVGGGVNELSQIGCQLSAGLREQLFVL